MRTTRRKMVSLLAAGSCVALVLTGSHAAEAQCLLVSPSLDRASVQSRHCLACHNGSAGPAVPLHDSHPVDRAYADAWLQRRAGLRAIPALEIVLAGGRVTCTSCHDGASSFPRKTALPQATLCQGCHDR